MRAFGTPTHVALFAHFPCVVFIVVRDEASRVDPVQQADKLDEAHQVHQVFPMSKAYHLQTNKYQIKAGQIIAGTKDTYTSTNGSVNFKCAAHEVYQVKP